MVSKVVGVFPMLVAFKGKVLDYVKISVRWASSGFEMDEHGRVGAKLHAAAKAFLVLGLVGTHVLCKADIMLATDMRRLIILGEKLQRK